jgi:outer membrane immunogenic protein
MKIFVVAVAVLIATPALAADLGKPVHKAPPPATPVPVWSWTGFYVGANAGGAGGLASCGSSRPNSKVS